MRKSDPPAEWAAGHTRAPADTRPEKGHGRRIVDDVTFAALEGAVGEGVLEEIVGLFLGSLPRLCDGVAGGGDEGNDVARAAAHELKGNAGMLGAVELAEACARYCTDYDEGKRASAAHNAAAILDASSAFEAWLKTRSGAEPTKL